MHETPPNDNDNIEPKPPAEPTGAEANAPADTIDPRQIEAIKAFLAQQRAAMGFT